MKLIGIKKDRLFSNKFAGVMGLITGLMFGSATSSFGISIGLASGSSPDCSGLVSVQGAVVCLSCPEVPEPGVVVDNNGNTVGGGNSVSVTCLDNVWSGTWGPTTVSLSKGVNIITASDNCGSASLSVPSSGGAKDHPSIQWTGSPVCSAGTIFGFDSKLTFCCITTESGFKFYEQWTLIRDPNTDCDPEPPISQDPKGGNWLDFDPIGCWYAIDHNNMTPWVGTPKVFPCNCIVNASQAITIKDWLGNVVGTFTDNIHVEFGACPASVNTVNTFRIGGDAVGGDSGGVTMHCP